VVRLEKLRFGGIHKKVGPALKLKAEGSKKDKSLGNLVIQSFNNFLPFLT